MFKITKENEKELIEVIKRYKTYIEKSTQEIERLKICISIGIDPYPPEVIDNYSEPEDEIEDLEDSLKFTKIKLDNAKKQLIEVQKGILENEEMDKDEKIIKAIEDFKMKIRLRSGEDNYPEFEPCNTCGNLKELTKDDKCIYYTFPKSKCSRCKYYNEFVACNFDMSYANLR